MTGIMIAAPSSGSGKTTVTLGILRAFRNRGWSVRPGKAGPDYIDPAFHKVASGKDCFNFDAWAMRPGLLHMLAAGAGPFVLEAMMGLFDAGADGRGSPAQLAKILGLSVVLVVDCGRMSQSVGALVRGYATHDPDVKIAGLILNRVGSDKHERLLRSGLAELSIPVFGVVRSDRLLSLPERHLGLVQAGEIFEIDAFMERAAERMEQSVDLDRLFALAERAEAVAEAPPCLVPPLGKHVAIARDEAFAFIYPHLVAGWRSQGSDISFFSPLKDEGPAREADSVYLPGGYPELHAGRIAAASAFKRSVRERAAAGQTIYGECGGYMTLGDALVDAEGKSHEMLGLLPLTTSYKTRKRQLGYRRLECRAGPFAGLGFMGHEFHYSTVVSEGGEAERLFDACDAEENFLGKYGLVRGSVSGSYMHLIDLAGA